MERNQVRQVITAQFHQSLAENRIQIESIPPNELQAIVNALADGVFAALAAVEDEAEVPVASQGGEPAAAAAPPGTSDEEQLLWRGRPYLSIGTIYELTTQRLRILRGIFGNTVEEIELVRVKDTRVKQHAGERMLDVGDITVISTDPSTPEKTLHNVRNPLEVRELIRKATMGEKQRRGMRYREELS
ncbi:MAG: hypothetical protein DCC55_32105 [Chloroflexi bacterium]|nr:MAG: hypothetical protein DCC55_32105 [Chloroflexota bacterium]